VSQQLERLLSEEVAQLTLDKESNDVEEHNYMRTVLGKLNQRGIIAG
jgi:hypothetical protein